MHWQIGQEELVNTGLSDANLKHVHYAWEASSGASDDICCTGGEQITVVHLEPLKVYRPCGLGLMFCLNQVQ